MHLRVSDILHTSMVLGGQNIMILHGVLQSNIFAKLSSQGVKFYKNKISCVIFLLEILKPSYLDSCYSVDANQVIRVPSKKGGSVSRPLEASAVRSTRLRADLIKVLWSQRIDDNLALQVPNLDLLVSCRAQPVAIGGEAKRVDDLSCLKGVKTLTLI
mmetsp:Transcript_7700/g.8896  ORF Transcript_7700/g.8896 Transcript_7700/m.8896 type:complete len:158 (+) Transcript_7700:130-603(+)